MVKAMKQQTWVHAVGEIKIDKGIQSIENWINFEDAIEIDRNRDGNIRYSNKKDDVVYQYNVQRNSLTIASMSDEYTPRGEALPRSPLELLEKIISQYAAEDHADISRSIVNENGRDIEVVRIMLDLEDDTHIKVDYTLRIDKSTQLLEKIDSVVLRDGVQFSSLDIRIDYPQTGPQDIYAAGVPLTVEILDRRPKSGTDEITAIQYKKLQNAENSSRDKLILYGSLNMDLVWIPKGEFLMGSPAEEVGYPDRMLELFSRSKKAQTRNRKHPQTEDPQHRVQIERGYFMSQYEVTCKQFRVYKRSYRRLPHSFGGRGKRRIKFQLDTDDQPVHVDLDEARAYCQWLSEKSGLLVQLPCEAQWEYACRAGTQTRFYWGDSVGQAGQYANLADLSYEKLAPRDADTLSVDDGYPCMAPVGQFLPNAFGLYDMLGNSLELVDGIYSKNAHSIDPNQYTVDQDEEYHKGGYWRGSLTDGRCASRSAGSAGGTGGFRVIVTMP
jgi:sulfatase modifying factor 1